MANPLGNWIDLSAVSNLYIQTYVKGFVDMSGGNLILRNNSIYVNSGDLSLGGRLLTIGDASLGGNLYVNKKLTVSGDVSMNGNLVVYGNLSVQTASNTNIINTTVNNYQLVVTDDISLNGRILVSQDASFGGNLVLTGTGTSGRVGIGKSNPLYPLDISGSLNLSNTSATATYNDLYGKVAPTTAYPSTISPNTTNATSNAWTNNNVTWKSSASSFYASVNAPYFAFDNTNTTNYTSFGGSTVYSTAAGAYVGNTITTNIIGPAGPATPLSLSGEWLQIQSSIPLTMNSYQLVTPNANIQLPSKYRIAGSSDGNTWYLIQDCVFSVIPSSTGNTLLNGSAPISTTSSVNVTIGSATLNITNQSSYSTLPYTYFRMITNAVFATANAFSLCEWLINFRLPSVTGPSNAIMYMDVSNINQLDISGSLGLINSSPTTTVTPCIANPSASSWTNNNITWAASASSIQNTTSGYAAQAFLSPSVFIGTAAYNGWITSATYTITTGVYSPITNSTITQNNGTINGEWLQIQSSIPLYLNGYSLATQSNFQSDLPRSYNIVASNNGTTWYDIHDAAFTAWPGHLPPGASYNVNQTTPFYSVFSATSVTVDKNSITAKPTFQVNTYTYFRLIVKSIIGTSNYSATGGNGQLRCFWNPVFTPQTSSVSLALDNGTPNQLNVGGSMSIADGFVGIGTTSPQYKLDVNGTINTNNGFNLSYSTPPTLTNTQIGYFYNPTSATSTSLANGSTTIYTVTPVAGVYIFNLDGCLNSPSNRSNTTTTITLYKDSVFVSQNVKGWGDTTAFAYVDCPVSVTGFVSVTGSQAVRFVVANSGLTCVFVYTPKYIRIA